MVKVNQQEPNAEFGADVFKKPNERHRIGATRDGHAHAVTWRDKPRTANRSQDTPLEFSCLR